MPEPFDALAADLAAFQAAHVPGIRAPLRDAWRRPAGHHPGLGGTGGSRREAFKLASVFAFAASDAAFTFRTSGTTSGAPGTHAMRSAASYDAAAIAYGAAMFAGGLAAGGERVPVLVIGSSDVEAPHSSLSHMCALFARAFGAGGDGSAFFVRGGVLEVDALLDRIASLPRDVPALVLSTSFGLVHCLDAMGERTSSAGQPGDADGRLQGPIARGLCGRAAPRGRAGVRRSTSGAVVAEYGMTELSSQFWEATLVDESAAHGEYAGPPWARVVPVDPETLAPAADGRRDCADRGSRKRRQRLRRAHAGPRAPDRHPISSCWDVRPARRRAVCSIALDEMLSTTAPAGRGAPDEHPMSRTVDERVEDVRAWLAAARAVHADRARLLAPIAASTGLSPEGVELGFDCLERDATDAELRALVASAGDAARVHVILSANVFVAPLRAIAIARAASACVTVRPSPRDPTLAAALVAAAGDPAVSIAMGRDLPAQADRIDVYGRDETIATVRSLARPGVVVRGHGAGLGVAYVTGAHRSSSRRGRPSGSRPMSSRSISEAALSPRIAFVEGSAARAEEAFARAPRRPTLRTGLSRAARHADARRARRSALRWRETLTFAGQVWPGAHHVVALAAPGMPLALPPVGRHVLCSCPSVRRRGHYASASSSRRSRGLSSRSWSQRLRAPRGDRFSARPPGHPADRCNARLSTGPSIDRSF